jgi:hypothetical protein
VRFVFLIIGVIILVAAAQQPGFNGLNLLGWLIFCLALFRIIARKPHPHR